MSFTLLINFLHTTFSLNTLEINSCIFHQFETHFTVENPSVRYTIENSMKSLQGVVLQFPETYLHFRWCLILWIWQLNTV